MTSLPRLVILEGPDGAGKSTLVEQLRKEYELSGEFRTVRVVHHGPYRGETKIAARYFTPMARCIVERDTALIMDRSWLSEPIYAKAMKRGGSRITFEEDRMLSRAALALDASLVICLPPLETVLENRPDDWWITDAHTSYAEVIAEGLTLRAGWVGAHLPPAIEFDYTEDYFHTSLLKMRRYPNTGPGAGVMAPDAILMVGDRPNTARHGDVKHRVPFVSFGRRDGCSWWLANQLDRGFISELELYWINAYDKLGEPTEAEFIETMRPRAIVLLGLNAMKWYRKTAADVVKRLEDEPPIYEEYHPQAWKRFHYTEPYHLIDVLKGLNI